MKIRMAYSKKDAAQYIAHLDMTRLFQRAFRRAEVALVYSEGFNPHAKISFGAPLPVGMVGEREYVDVEIQDLAFEELRQAFSRLSAQMPPGIDLLSWQSLPQGVPKLMALLDTAVYEVEVPWRKTEEEDAEALARAARRWLERSEILWNRQKEGKTFPLDIRPFIRSIDVSCVRLLSKAEEGREERRLAVLELAAVLGNAGSVRPMEILGAFCRDEGISFDLDSVKVKRVGVYWLDSGGERRAPDS